MTDWAKITAVLRGYPVPVPMEGDGAVAVKGGWLILNSGDLLVMECPHRGCTYGRAGSRCWNSAAWRNSLKRHERREHSPLRFLSRLLGRWAAAS